MLTAPTIFIDDTARADHKATWVLEITDSTSITYLLSDRAFTLTDGHVFDVGLELLALSLEVDIYQTSSTPTTATVSASNVDFTSTAASGAINLSFIFTLAQTNTANLYLLSENAGALSDGLKIFQGHLLGDPSFNDSEITFELVDATSFDSFDIPHEPISADFSDSMAAKFNRHYPLIWGSLKHPDNFRQGALALAEEISDRDWCLSNEVLKSVSKLWVYYQTFGDFMEVIEPAVTTLSNAVVATDTSLVIGSRSLFQRRDFIVVAIGTANEEVLEISGFASGRKLNLVSGFVNAHSAGVTVQRAYVAKDYKSRGWVRLMREIGDVSEGDIRYKLDYFRLKGYIRPSRISDPKQVNEHKDNQTYVTATSNSGQKTLTVASTDGLTPQLSLDIDPDGGGGGSETKTIDRVTSGTTVELTANLTNTHTAAQGDVVIPTTLIDTDDVDDFDNCRDGRDDTFALVNVGEIVGSTRHANLNVAFDDLDTTRKQVGNRIGFITDFGTFVYAEPAPSVSATGSTAVFRAGRTGSISAAYRQSSKVKTSSTHDEDSHQGDDATILRMFSLEGAESTTTSVNNSSGQNHVVIPSGDIKKYSKGNKIIINEGNANEETHTITDIDDSTKLYLDGTLANTHLAGVVIRNLGQIGIFWAFGQGDQNEGKGVTIQLEMQSSSIVSIGSPLMRVYDIGIYVTCLAFTKPIGVNTINFVDFPALPRSFDIPIGFGGR